ncbi:hypothetical protein EMCRGX_G025936 [Ephydatia muelleri]|eukprot:Em0021g662a
MDSGIDLDSFALPVANKENKELQLEIERKQKEIASLKRQSEGYADRIQALSDHLKNVQQELQHTQALHEAKRKDVELEQHMRQIAEREEGRLRDELKKIETEESDIKERINMYENTAFKNKKRVEDITAQMNWGHQALDAWLEESARKDDNALTIEKYSRADEGKVKELTLKLENYSDEMQRKKKALDNDVTDTISAQIELDNIAKAFRQANEERQELVDQWEQTIEQMKKRDQDMDKCATEIAGLKAEVRAKEDLIGEKEEFLSQELVNNREMEKRVEGSEREVARHRQQYQEAEAGRIEFRDELETLKYSVERTATDVDSMQAKAKQLSRDIKDRKRQMETLKHQRELMQEELKSSTKKTLNAEERAHQMDEVMSSEEAKLVQLEKEVTLQREKQFKKAQELFELNTKHSNMESELQGTRVALRNLRSKQHRLDEEAMKQQEILYTQDFQLQQLHHKMSRLEGERTGDERAKLTEKIKTLEEDWGKQQQSEQLLRNQLKRSQDDLLRAGRYLETRKKEKDTLQEKIDEINLHIDNTQRESKKVLKQKQDLMVDENIMKLQIKRLRNTLYSHADEVLSLEQREKQLETTMAERTHEINVHKEMLRTQCKSSEQERQTVTTELQDRISKIDRLRKRYEIITVSMQPPEGEEQSQAYYVIKAAQEREDLQRTGDELDAKIKKSEREIRAMENTLQLMNSKNESYRKSLHRVDGSSEEAAQLEVLAGQLQTFQGKLKYKRKQSQQLTEDLQSMEKTLSALTSEEIDIMGHVQQEGGKLMVMNKELEELRAKQERAERQILKVMKELKAKGSDTSLEQDIQLRELKAFSTSIVQYLGTLATSHPESASTLNVLFSQYGVAPPPSPAGSRTGSRTGSLPTSARSSHVSLSSSRTSVHSVPRTPSSPLQTKTVNLSQQAFTGVAGSPTAGAVLKSSSSRKLSKEGSRETSRPPSNASSRHSSKPPSRTQSSSSRKGLDLSIGPS